MISPFLAAVAASVASATVPTGATVGPGGYWTILSAPPAPFVMDLPAPLPPPGAAQQRASDRFWEYARWQGRISGEAATVGNFLREREKGNYVPRPRTWSRIATSSPSTARSIRRRRICSTRR